jgi:CheY-like chemotaxis protein
MTVARPNPVRRDVLATLVVLEDGDGDFAVLQRVLTELRPELILDRVRNGDDLLARMVEDPEGLLARLALFDVNVPGLSGVQTLAEWRRHEVLSLVPVVMLSGSARSEEVDECYRLGVAGYLAKPFGLAGYRRMLKAVASFWLETTMPSAAIGAVADGDGPVGEGR